MRQLNSEYQQLRQARLDRKGEYKNQYDQLSAIRKERQKDIQTRQQEFEKEMMQKEEAKQKKQHDSDLIACDTLERLLQQVLDQQEQDVEELGIDGNPAQERIQLVNSPIEQEEDDGVDTSVLMIPLGIMELFWEIHVQVPVRFTEIEPTLNRIRERRAELSR
ncbi:hypothetical protein O0I10_008984 [Lichtheimia ornata]|uniref:Uncharacterized protein n=1 Tax=Lichtheimia ornata TaxID=688661 RepID=A0AAD7XUT5_9FUNG|nr:uncharacterized protein O0I10_008984 [Lichtheimia ornata]KAJ8655295.1 hypothetical protein O0I10_008984 [Lichtheimia ornata]